jgi:hypothetical protein
MVTVDGTASAEGIWLTSISSVTTAPTAVGLPGALTDPSGFNTAETPGPSGSGGGGLPATATVRGAEL